ncbi:MAG: hypothetical protein SFV18_09730 [Bryobacteraceae bacterium]|nr:hypothetical protein [Bryobacteraceae bacterium]
MATLARTFGNAGWDEAPRSEARKRDAAVSETADSDIYLLRPLPNEGVFLYVKRFDNTRVVRQADPHARRTAWKTIGGSCAAAALLIGLLFPGAYRLLAGFQIERLKTETREARMLLETLTYEEAYRARIQRVHDTAVAKGYQPPAAGQVEFAQPKASVARLEPAAEPEK